MADIGNRFFKLVNNEVVFGECETVDAGNGPEILIKCPFTAKNGNIMPYMQDIMTESPKAVQIHPINILWNVPLDEFPNANKLYVEHMGTNVKFESQKAKERKPYNY